MVYAINSDVNNINYSVSGLRDIVASGHEAIADLFFKKPVPARSLSNCLKKVHLNPEVQSLKRDWQKFSSESGRNAESRRLTAEYDKQVKNHGQLVNIPYNKLFGSLGLNAGCSGLFMPGIAMIAAHLKQKKGVEDLFVCATRKALLAKIEEILANPADQRCSLIACSSNNDSLDWPIHKMAIAIEKKEGKLQIAVLDSMGSDSYSSSVIYDILKVCDAASCDPVVSLSMIRRESGGYGCGVFALQDAISFLQDKDFFQQINFNGAKSYRGHEVKSLSKLPLAFRIGTQSMQEIEECKRVEGEKAFDQPIPGRKKTLGEYLKRNVLDHGGKRQNHYITKKTLQYQQFITVALKELTTDELKNMINETLLT